MNLESVYELKMFWSKYVDNNGNVTPRDDGGGEQILFPSFVITHAPLFFIFELSYPGVKNPRRYFQ